MMSYDAAPMVPERFLEQRLMQPAQVIILQQLAHHVGWDLARSLGARHP
jgi:hypothetical protein